LTIVDFMIVTPRWQKEANNMPRLSRQNCDRTHRRFSWPRGKTADFTDYGDRSGARCKTEIVSKRRGSRYAGGRTHDWLKVKQRSQRPLPDARRTIPEAPKGNRSALKHGRYMIEAERRKLGQYWFQDGQKFAQCFQDSARCILSKIDQRWSPAIEPGRIEPAGLSGIA
jgi:hypothetical protein